MTTTARFTKNQEDFICAVCGTHVHGNGYTNHCPNCLSSLHVDINPGDRACSCGGIMLAVELEHRNGKDIILHRCQKCGFERKNQRAPEDNFNAILSLSNGTFPEYLKTITPKKNIDQ